MGRHRKYSLFVVLSLLLLTATASAQQVFKCRDEGGAIRFQDRPCSGEAVVSPGSGASGAASPDADGAPAGKHYFWQADAGKGTLYLLGSIHFGTDEMYPLPGIMTSLFKQADALVVEADVSNLDPAATARLVAEKAMYRDGTTLQQQLSPELWQHLQAASTKLGMPVELLNMQKPWFVSMTLTALALNKLGYAEDKGIDIHFLSLAKGKKKVIELEGFEWQLSLFDRMTAKEQIKMLEETLGELEQGKAYFDELLAAWQAGDAAAIQKLFDDEASASGDEKFNRMILTDRNKTMTEKLHAMAEQGGRYFVVVGAGHMSGELGIVARLRQRGYRIKQL
jgi:uncharacterized protein YbaP (TraB family)